MGLQSFDSQHQHIEERRHQRHCARQCQRHCNEAPEYRQGPFRIPWKLNCDHHHPDENILKVNHSYPHYPNKIVCVRHHKYRQLLKLNSWYSGDTREYQWRLLGGRGLVTGLCSHTSLSTPTPAAFLGKWKSAYPVAPECRLNDKWAMTKQVYAHPEWS